VILFSDICLTIETAPSHIFVSGLTWSPCRKIGELDEIDLALIIVVPCN